MTYQHRKKAWSGVAAAAAAAARSPLCCRAGTLGCCPVRARCGALKVRVITPQHADSHRPLHPHKLLQICRLIGRAGPRRHPTGAGG